MITDMDKTEASIPIYSKAVKKFDKCKHREDLFGQMACRLFHYTFDTSTDLVNHCGSCKLNTKEPTNKRTDVRFR